MNTYSKYTHFQISNNITSYIHFCLFLGNLEAYSEPCQTSEKNSQWLKAFC